MSDDFADVLRDDPVLRDKILQEHAPDAEGRCPVCRPGNHNTGRVKSPCTLLAAARAAKKPRR